jgi:hypothetical protein
VAFARRSGGQPNEGEANPADGRGSPRIGCGRLTRISPYPRISRRAVFESVVGMAFGQGMSRVLRAADLPSHLEVGDASIDVSVDSDQFDIDRASLFDWVMQSARATTAYFGQFQVTHARVRLLQSEGARVSNGVSFGEPGRDAGSRWVNMSRRPISLTIGC